MLVQSAIWTLKLLAWSMCLLTRVDALSNTTAASTLQLETCQAYWLQLKPKAFVAGFPLRSACRYDLKSRFDPNNQDTYATHTWGKFPRRYDTPKDDRRPLEGLDPAYTGCYLIEEDARCPHGEAKNENYFQLSAPPGHNSKQKYGLFCMYIKNLLLKPELPPNNAFPGWTVDWEDQNDKHHQCKLKYTYTPPTNAAWLTFHPLGDKAVHGDFCPYQLQTARLDSNGAPARSSNALSGTNSVWYCRFILADPRCKQNQWRHDNFFQVHGPRENIWFGIFCPLKGDSRLPPPEAHAQLRIPGVRRPTWRYDVSSASWFHTAVNH